jgi:hypothetical protein
MSDKTAERYMTLANNRIKLEARLREPRWPLARSQVTTSLPCSTEQLREATRPFGSLSIGLMKPPSYHPLRHRAFVAGRASAEPGFQITRF